MKNRALPWILNVETEVHRTDYFSSLAEAIQSFFKSTNSFLYPYFESNY